MFNKIRNCRIRRVVARHAIAERLWQDALRRCAPQRVRWALPTRPRCAGLTTLFLDRKSLNPAKAIAEIKKLMLERRSA